MKEKKTANPTQYKNQFQREKYDRLAVQIKKGEREQLRQIAESKGYSLNGYIRHLLKQDTGLDL